jgi:hypothetical protein
MISCPRCSSENVQSLKVIYETGTSNIDTKSSGYFGGASSGSDYSHSGRGFGGWTSGTTKGTQQTEAAQQATPPAKKDIGGPFLGIVIGIGALIGFFGSWSLWALLIGVFFLAGGIWALVEAIKWNEEKWPGLYDHWLRSFRCLRCGEVFAHSESQ